MTTQTQIYSRNGAKDTASQSHTLSSQTLTAWLIVCSVWGSTYLAIRFALQGFPPLVMTGIRFSVAGGVLLLIARLRGMPLPTQREWKAAAFIGILMIASNAAVVFVEQWVSSGIAALSVSAVPLWVAILSIFFGQPPSRREWLGIGIGFVGIVLLNSQGDLHARPFAALLLMLSAVSWALGSVLSPRLPLPKGITASGAEMLTGGLFVLTIGLLRGESLHSVPALVPAAALLYLIVFGSLIAFSANDYLLRHARPALASSYAYVNPVVAVFLGMLIANEQITPMGLIALGVILSGVVLIVTGRHKSHG